MSPPTGTTQPSGFSHEESRKRRDEEYSEDMLVDFEAMKAFDNTAYETLPEEDRISLDEDDDVPPTAPLPASAVPSQPLSASPAMDATLAEISSGAPASRTRRDERRPGRGVDSYTVLKQNYEAMLQVEAAKKAEADRIAATSQALQPRPDKRDRTVSSESRTGSSKKTKGNQPAPDPNVMDMRQEGPAKNRPRSFDHLFKPRRSWCAVMIDRNEIMGNPFARSPGWDLKVLPDPGVLGQPSLGLNFRFSKDGSDSRKDEDYNTFAVGWEPGVEIGGQWMMEDLQFFAAANPSDSELINCTFPPAIRKLLDGVEDDKRKAEMASNLVCATFRSNVHKTSPVDPKWALALKYGAGKVPYDNLARMYSGEDPGYQVTMWFVNRELTLERFFSETFSPLANAVADHIPPFHQHLHEDDEPFMDYRLPNIHEIGNGMYRRYPNVVDYTSKRIANRSVNPTCFNLLKLVTWESIKTYYTGVVGPDMAKKPAQPYQHAQRERRKRVSRTPSQNPTVDLEMLRLKDRHTLHRLAPS